MDLQNLQEKMGFAWKLQTKSKDGRKASFAAYIDARDVMKRLDEVVGPTNWKDSYVLLVNNAVRCSLSIKAGDEWVAKEDVGTPSDYEMEKGAFSDAFKRAAVKWGIGRFLYDMEREWISINQYNEPLDEEGKKIVDISAYIERRKNMPKHETPLVELPKKEQLDPLEPHYSTEECPQCKQGKIIEKTGKFGTFHGCSKYPVCKYISK